MFIIKCFAIAFFVLFTSVSFALDWSECKNSGVGGMASAVTSSTQFTSSWGPCSIFGMKPENQSKLFIANNLEKVKVDAARGSGEYLVAFARLSKCSSKTMRLFSKKSQNSYSQVFNESAAYNPKSAYENFSNMVKNDPQLSCQYL